MPGRTDRFGSPLNWDEFVCAAESVGLDRILCLATRREVEIDSPDYAWAIRNGELPCVVEEHPIPDLGVPENAAAFDDLVVRSAASLRAGDRLLVHCAFGIGRTGTFATCLMVALGTPGALALDAVRAAGSRPERRIQEEFVRRFGG